MAYTLMAEQQKTNAGIHYETGFRNTIENFIYGLRRDATTQIQVIDGVTVSKYRGDFYGLLASLGVPFDYYHIYLRVNGLKSPTDFGTNLTDPYSMDSTFTLYRPTNENIGNIERLYSTIQ